ncbi:hypothetical protein NL50_06855 [Clostridium acetobutylicum]|nr:hypothetical protein NL50_06855 [Clostridium acetobutylicum]
MKRIHKNIFTTCTTLALITGVIYLGIRTNSTPSTSNITKINKPLYGTKIKNKKSLKTSSRKIVIYNSESGEDYPSGKNVTDVGKLLNKKLKKDGLNSTFIKNPITTKNVTTSYSDYLKTYDITRNLIKQNVKDYSKCILLDIYREKGPSKNDVEISLVKNIPNYTKNNEFAKSLISQLNKLNCKAGICHYTLSNANFNQDLSDRSIMLGIGNIKSSDRELNNLVNSVSTALKNMH